MKKLSAYTVARYCSDIADVTAGIDEITEAIQARYKSGRNTPHFYYVRLKKLKNELNKLTNKKSNNMNYRCKELQSMIDRYESTGNAGELAGSLKRHIAEYGGIYEVAGISKEDFAGWGYDTDKVTDELLECIARKTDISDSLTYAVEYWADRYGIPKKEEA
jgi:hypothetical protein